jgi:hypothetical protein
MSLPNDTGPITNDALANLLGSESSLSNDTGPITYDALADLLANASIGGGGGTVGGGTGGDGLTLAQVRSDINTNGIFEGNIIYSAEGLKPGMPAIVEIPKMLIVGEVPEGDEETEFVAITPAFIDTPLISAVHGGIANLTSTAIAAYESITTPVAFIPSTTSAVIMTVIWRFIAGISELGPYLSLDCKLEPGDVRSAYRWQYRTANDAFSAGVPPKATTIVDPWSEEEDDPPPPPPQTPKPDGAAPPIES